MGSTDVASGADSQRMRAFTRAVLDDMHGLERLIAEDKIEKGVRRIGAEQEMFLIDRSRQPAPIAVELLQQLEGEERLTTELAKFNLEANLSPQVFGTNCLSAMEEELKDLLDRVDEAAAKLGSAVALTGILPTLRMSHLSLDNMTPNPRYFELNRAISHLTNGNFAIVIKGLDEIDINHDNVMLEGGQHQLPDPLPGRARRVCAALQPGAGDQRTRARRGGQLAAAARSAFVERDARGLVPAQRRRPLGHAQDARQAGARELR